MLADFAEHTRGLTLVPGIHGIFDVAINGEVIFSRKQAGRFPEIPELKQAITGRLG